MKLGYKLHISCIFSFVEIQGLQSRKYMHMARLSISAQPIRLQYALPITA